MKRNHALLLIPIVAAAVVWAGFQTARDDDFYAMRKNFELFGAVYEQVVGGYVSRVDPERFMRTGLDAMLADLDPWTDFFDEADNVAMRQRGRSGLGEVGLRLGRRGGRLTVLEPDERASAYRQGIRTGDVVLRIADVPADSLSLAEADALLRGQPGTVVELQAERGGEPIVFRLRREPPVVRFVSFAERLEGTELALVRMDAFGPGSAEEIVEAVDSLRSAGALDGLILDLRDNPGGLLNEAITLADAFLPAGATIVSTRGRAAETVQVYDAPTEPRMDALPVVVLMNRFSASASEIVAGALQDLDRAAIVGEPSFGKGLVQVIRPLPYNTALKMTISRYYTPSGRGIRQDASASAVAAFFTPNGRPIREGFGIEPDEVVDVPEASDLEQALSRAAAFFEYAGHLVDDRRDELEAAARASGRIELPSDAIDGFREWLATRDFDLRLPLERDAAALRDQTTDAQTRAAADGLVRATERARDRSFDENAERLRERLSAEVAARLLSPSVRFRESLVDDPYVEAARRLLQDRPRYDALLGNG